MRGCFRIRVASTRCISMATVLPKSYWNCPRVNTPQNGSTPRPAKLRDGKDFAIAAVKKPYRHRRFRMGSLCSWRDYRQPQLYGIRALVGRFPVNAGIAELFAVGSRHVLSDLHGPAIREHLARPSVHHSALTLQRAFDHILAETGQDKHGVGARNQLFASVQFASVGRFDRLLVGVLCVQMEQKAARNGFDKVSRAPARTAELIVQRIRIEFPSAGEWVGAHSTYFIART